MRTFPAPFTTEIVKKTGITPIWILRIVVDGVTYDLSDTAYAFPGGMANGFTTTLPWVGSWGEVRESISGAIGEMLIADFSCTILVDQDYANNIRHLALSHPLEQSPVALYLWLDGLASVTPPQQLFVGFVKDIDIPDETQVHLTIEDESSRFQKYLGTQISSEAYPLCDPDVVGKMIPIVYGTVEKLPALCVDSGWVSSLVADLAPYVYSAAVSELPHGYSLLNKNITIDDETLLVSAVNGTTLSFSRSAAATPHTKGSVVMEKRAATAPLVYLVADHAVTAIGTVLARVRGVDVDISADVTKYLSITSGQLGGLYTGKAAITIPDFAKVQQKIIISLNGDVAASQAAHNHVTGNTTESTTQYIYPGSLSQSYNVRYNTGYMYGHVYTNFPAVSNITACTITAAITCPAGSTISFGGIDIVTNSAAMTNQTVSHIFTSTEVSNMQNAQIHIGVYIGWKSATTSYDDWRTVTATVSSASRAITYPLSGVPTTSNSANITVSNTLGLSGNSIADVMVGDMILVNVTRNITAPAAVIGNLLSTYCSDATLITAGTVPATYTFNGALTEYKKAIDWLDYLSFQCVAFFRKMGGISKLIVRDVNPALTGIIPACCLTDEGIKALSYRKAPLSDVINKVKVYYSRDWTISSKSAASYRKSIDTTAAASIAIFGEQERPDMFMFDFVTDASMANDLAAFYLNFYAARKWRISFSTFLDNAKYEFGDIVQLTFADGVVGGIVEAGITPGSSSQIDTMNFIIEAA